MCTTFIDVRITAVSVLKLKVNFLLLYLLLGGCFVLRYGHKYPRLVSTHEVAKDDPKLEILLRLLPAC